MRTSISRCSPAEFYTILFLASLSAGCGVSRVECAIFSDCGAGEQCGADGKCVAVDKADCHEDADCGSDRFCTRRGCVLGPVCSVAADCGAGYLCDRHECLADSCSADADCAIGACVSGRCQECAADSDCAGRAFCAEGLCALPECQGDSDCAAGEECIAARCLTMVPSGQRYRVQEQAEVRIVLPEAATVTSPGVSDLGTLRVDAEGLLFRSTGCAAAEGQVGTVLRLPDGSAEQLDWVVKVVDTEAPLAPELSLSDLPAAEQVELSFEVPLENSAGSCPTRRFELEWSVDGGGAQEEVIEFKEASLGQLVRRSFDVPTGEVFTVKLRAVDEAGNATEVEAQQALIRPVVRSFALSTDHAPPADTIEVSYDVGRATQVELFRDGVSVDGAPKASEGQGSWQLPVGVQNSTFVLHVFDQSGNRHIHPQALSLTVDASLEVEPNDTQATATEMGLRAAGTLSGAGDVDFFKFYNNGEHHIWAFRAESLGGECQNFSMYLTSADGTGVWGLSGPCPVTNQDQFSRGLSTGWYFFEIRSTGAASSYSVVRDALDGLHPRAWERLLLASALFGMAPITAG